MGNECACIKQEENHVELNLPKERKTKASVWTKKVYVSIGKDSKENLREVKKGWTVKDFIDDVYCDLEDCTEFEHLITEVSSCSIHTGKKEYRYDLHSLTPLQSIDHFDWEKKDSIPNFRFSFGYFAPKKKQIL